MKIGKDGQFEKEESSQDVGGLNLSNEQIIFMYLSTRGAYLATKKEAKKREKHIKMIQTLLSHMDEDGDSGIGMISSKGKGKDEMLQEITEAAEKMGKESPQDKYIKSIYTKLFPYWVILRESAEDLVKEVIETGFNGESDIIKAMLTEETVD